MFYILCFTCYLFNLYITTSDIYVCKVNDLGKGPKIKKRKSTVFDHTPPPPPPPSPPA